MPDPTPPSSPRIPRKTNEVGMNREANANAESSIVAKTDSPLEYLDVHRFDAGSVNNRSVNDDSASSLHNVNSTMSSDSSSRMIRLEELILYFAAVVHHHEGDEVSRPSVDKKQLISLKQTR